MTERGFNKRDETLVELLMSTGMPRNVAKTLAFLRKKPETTSVEIEVSTALRQPEVSIAMQELRRRKWVTKRDIKKEGKGRPIHAYRLAIPFEKIIETIEKEERKRIEKIEQNVNQLKQFVSSSSESVSESENVGTTQQQSQVS
ncbi:MAG: ArsR family transcriptional regulator [Methanomassiliicoccales archaeon]|jgi:predicted transcriptional regulator|nr:ArsR family transcriptional regulator [Methanomassiliicoccales archaeon]